MGACSSTNSIHPMPNSPPPVGNEAVTGQAPIAAASTPVLEPKEKEEVRGPVKVHTYSIHSEYNG